MGGHLPVLAHIGSAGENATLIGGHRLLVGHINRLKGVVWRKRADEDPDID